MLTKQLIGYENLYMLHYIRVILNNLTQPKSTHGLPTQAIRFAYWEFIFGKL